jgi:hypothetical protein
MLLVRYTRHRSGERDAGHRAKVRPQSFMLENRPKTKRE